MGLCSILYTWKWILIVSLQWRHNEVDSVSNHQPHGCLLNRLFRRRSKKTSKLRVTGLCVGNSPGPVNSPHKGPVTRKMFPFDDVIMMIYLRHLRSMISLSFLVTEDYTETFFEIQLSQRLRGFRWSYWRTQTRDKPLYIFCVTYDRTYHYLLL